MNDEKDSQQTHSARDIVLELFPATHERLVPKAEEYKLETRSEGVLVIRHLPTERELVLVPIAPAGNASTQVCCDLCSRNAPRHYMQTARVALPGSNGRRFRYLSLCRDTEACAARRLGDETLAEVLASAFEG